MWLKNFCGYNIFAPFCLTISLIFELLSHLLSSSFFLFLLVYLSFIFLIQFVCCLPFFLCHLTAKLSSLPCLLKRLGQYLCSVPCSGIDQLRHIELLPKYPPSPLLPSLECLHCATSREKSKRVDWRRKRLNNNIVASFLLGKQKCLEKYVWRAAKSWARAGSQTFKNALHKEEAQEVPCAL